MRTKLLLTTLLAILPLIWLAACGTQKPVHTKPTVVLDPAARDARIQSDLTTLKDHVETYFNRYGVIPEHLPQLRDTPDGTQIITDIPLDPWRVPYLLRRLDDDVEVYTAGPDLIIGSTDDIVLRLSFAGVTPASEVPEPAL